MPDNVTVSEKPWSDYSEADYTPEQWHAACLIHQHEGAPTAKDQCKLPVRTPNGTLNRNGVHAAAAALAGARGGVDATPAEKSAAARAIVRLYGQLDEKAPPSMMDLTHKEKVDEFLAHISRSTGTFDESKVKRDKGGKFAKIAELSPEDLMDAKWMDPDNLMAIAMRISKENSNLLDDMLASIAEREGMSVDDVAASMMLRPEVVAGAVDVINRMANVSDGGISPSGKKHLVAVADEKEPNGFRVINEPYVGFHINPKAKLNPSRVRDSGSWDFVDKVKNIVFPMFHGDSNVEDFLEHYGIALDESNSEGVVVDSDAYGSMSDIQKIVSTFVMAGALSNAEGTAKHADVDEFLAHFGVKGMKWNLRKTATALATAEGKVISPERAKAHNAISDRLSKGIMAARTQSQIERILSLAKTSTLMRGIIKLNNIEISPDGKKARYSMTISRLTPGKTNTDTKDGIQVENLLKEVDRTPDVPVAGATKGQVADMRKVAGATKAQVAATRKVTHSESLLDNFLKHYGVKGMKWGVRKAEDSGGSKSKSSSPSKKEVKIAEANKDTQVSVDAERFVRTRMKAQHEMSDREIREAVQRAEWVKKYDVAFNPDANAQLQAKVNQMQLQKQYAQLSREMNPTKVDRVKDFINKADSAYSSYQHINELSGGVLNATLAKSMGISKQESHYDRLLRENKILSAEREHSTLLKDLDEPMIKRDYFPKHSTTTPVGKHQLELPGKHRA